MDAVLLLIQAVLIFGVSFIYSNLGLGGGLLFVPILLSTSVPDKDLAVPISLTLTIATATSSVINHHRRGRGRDRQREGDRHREILVGHAGRQEDRHKQESAPQGPIRIDER